MQAGNAPFITTYHTSWLGGPQINPRYRWSSMCQLRTSSTASLGSGPSRARIQTGAMLALSNITMDLGGIRLGNGAWCTPFARVPFADLSHVAFPVKTGRDCTIRKCPESGVARRTPGSCDALWLGTFPTVRDARLVIVARLLGSLPVCQRALYGIRINY